MDLLSFEGKKMLIDLRDCSRLFDCLTNRIGLSFNDDEIYRTIFAAIEELEEVDTNISLVPMNLLEEMLDDDSDYFLLEKKDVEIFESVFKSMTMTLLCQLKSLQLYANNRLMFQYRCKFGSNTAVLLERSR